MPTEGIGTRVPLNYFLGFANKIETTEIPKAIKTTAPPMKHLPSLSIKGFLEDNPFLIQGKVGSGLKR